MRLCFNHHALPRAGRADATVDYTLTRFIGDSGEAERIFRMESERHSGMNANIIGA
jgi:hypothetical protein